MATYTPQLIQLSVTSTRVEDDTNNYHGMPTGNFNYALMSMWLCFGIDLQARTFSFNCDGGVSIQASQTGSYQIFISVTHSALSPWFNGYFSANWGGNVSNVLISVDAVRGVVQCYANDVACPLVSGGLTGQPVAPMLLYPGFLWEAGAAPPGLGLGDFWLEAPTSFIDLSIAANRRKFINADLSPVDPAINGSGPFGTPPPIYLTARSGVANDFANNNGTGGAFPILAGPLTLLPAGTCTVAWPPAPVTPGSLAMDSVLALDLTPANVADTQIFLMWSDDRGHSYGSPVGQPIGAPGRYLTSPQWQRLGYARDRVFKLEWAVPVATALQGAFIDVDAQAKS